MINEVLFHKWLRADCTSIAIIQIHSIPAVRLVYVTFCTWQCAIWKSLELTADAYCLEMTNILEEGPVANFENAKKSCEILLDILENDI